MVRILSNAATEYGAKCLEWGGEFMLADKRIAVAHGHLTMDVKPLLEARPDYLMTGHTHEAADWQVGPTRRINPGALFRTDNPTVALLDLTQNELQFRTVK